MMKRLLAVFLALFVTACSPHHREREVVAENGTVPAIEKVAIVRKVNTAADSILVTIALGDSTGMEERMVQASLKSVEEILLYYGFDHLYTVVSDEGYCTIRTRASVAPDGMLFDLRHFEEESDRLRDGAREHGVVITRIQWCVWVLEKDIR